MDFFDNLIKKVNQESDINKIAERISPITNYDKWEPSYVIEYREKQYKIRVIKKKEEWQKKQKITRFINSIAPKTLPDIFYIADNFVIKEYIVGRDLSTKSNIDLKKLADAFFSFHNFSVLYPSSDFDKKIIENKIIITGINNLNYIKNLNIFNKKQISEIEAILSNLPDYNLGFVHGDLSFHNCVETKENFYRIIDIESLCVFPVEYDFVKSIKEVFNQESKIFRDAYSNLLDKYSENEPYWITYYYLQKIVERSQINRQNGVLKAVKQIEGIL